MSRTLRRIPGFRRDAISEGARLVAGATGPLVALSLFAMGAIMVLVGTQALRQVSDTDARVMNESLLFGTVGNMLRGNDVAGSVSVGHGPEGDVLVVRRGGGRAAYEVRLFLHRGRVMQETALVGAPVRADRAISVVPSSQFSVSVEDGGILVVADEGQAFFATRTSAAGATPLGGGAEEKTETSEPVQETGDPDGEGAAQ